LSLRPDRPPAPECERVHMRARLADGYADTRQPGPQVAEQERSQARKRTLSDGCRALLPTASQGMQSWRTVSNLFARPLCLRAFVVKSLVFSPRARPASCPPDDRAATPDGPAHVRRATNAAESRKQPHSKKCTCFRAIVVSVRSSSVRSVPLWWDC
jgi:hypothetical protein